jgi:two-component sensor histidine kinase
MQDVLAATLPVGAMLILISLWLVVTFRREARARQQLSRALEQNRVLLREVHHRVKNNLQTVAALISLQPGPPGPKQELVSRIAAMSAVHEHIYAADRFGSLNVADYISTLVARLQRSAGNPVAVDCRLAPLQVTPDQALPLGLIVNEVVSNAFKHAFPDGRAGHITVSLERADGHAVLTVRDDGIGYSPRDTTGNMGMKLIESLTRQIDGRHSFANRGGTIFTLEFPLPPIPDQPADAAPLRPASEQAAGRIAT